MIDDAFVFDGVAHPFNADPKNALGPPGEMFANHLYAFHATLTPDGETVLPAEEWLKQWDISEIREMVFDQSDTDMLISMPLPLTDLFRDGLSPWQECAELASRDPERIVFWGTVNPMEGRKALDEMEIQVREHGAKGFKFYNTRYDYGQPVPWRMDDPTIAFPVFEKAQELGVNLIGVHKGVPLGPQPVEHTQTWDMDGAAANFPDINFIIYHVGLPFLDETCWQLIRHPNLYASLAATIDFIVRAPRMFAEVIGKLLFWCGEDKIVYGSEAPIFHPQWAIQAFKDFQIPQDLVEGYGYPQLTDQAKRKILGENLLRLHGMDVEETVQRLGRRR
jgi:predicted TIM-barrel fold metal-dependent hydrolase